MADTLNTYKSTLTPQEVDEAFRNIGKVQANIEKAAGYAQTAEQYGTIVQQYQTAIQAIEDNLADILGAAQNAIDAKNAASSAAASASAASQSATDAEDAAKRAEAAAGVNPNDYYTKQQADAAFATADQGKLAQSAVQSVNGVHPDNGELTLPVGSKIAQVWANSTPYTDFAAQKISVDLSDSSLVIVIFGTFQQNKSIIVPVGTTGLADMSYVLQQDATSFFCANRLFSVATDGVTFNDSYYMWSNVTASKTLYNLHNVPQSIYKIIL